MNDRLAELKGGTITVSPLGGGSYVQAVPAGGSSDVETGRRRGSVFSSPNFMQDFFDKVNRVKAMVKEVKTASNTIQDLDQQMKMSVQSEKDKQVSDKIQGIVMRTNKVAKACKDLLKELEEENERAKETQQLQQNEMRIRENLVNTLKRKLADTVKLYQSRQQEFKEATKEKVSRQIRIMKQDATEEEVEEIMRSPGGAEEVFRTAILKSAADPVREAYEAAQNKYNDVMRLEQSVMELHQMFVDFALLTEQQGELLDQIEYQVQAAKEYVETGNEDLEKAIEYQKSIRKKQCCVIMTILIILVVILASTGVFGGGSGN